MKRLILHMLVVFSSSASLVAINQKEYRRLMQQVNEFFPNAFNANLAAQQALATCMQTEQGLNIRFGAMPGGQVNQVVSMNCQTYTQQAVIAARQAYNYQRSNSIVQYLTTIGTRPARQLLADLYARRLI